MSNQDAIVQEFLVESLENLEMLDRDLIHLEKESGNEEMLSSIFRAIHTIKGTSSFLGFSRLESLTHKGESLLSRLRDGKLELTTERTDALLDMVDAVRTMLGCIETTQSDGENDYSDLIDALTRLQEPDPDFESDSGQPTEKGRATDEASPSESKPVADRTIGNQETPDAGEKRVEQTPDTHETAANSTLRIDVRLLDKIMDLVGELVLARNQIVLHNQNEQDPEAVSRYQRLDHITSDLQESVLKTRMQRIDRIWNTVPRQVRDLANECGKQVRVELEGRETELDRSIIEAIKGPITHLVRNCIDHGLESPEERKASNKPVEGCIRLSARHESGQVVLEVSDDGRGLDVSRIREKALQREVVSPQVAEQMTQRHWFEMIFKPGFSTAAKVTNISGRGVGLDVVKTNIERLAGTIELKSNAGQGTTFIIRIPLTLAIIPALIVSEDGYCYAIPQTSLTELVRLDRDAIEQRVETIYNTKVLRLRGDLLPLLRLADLLGTEKGTSSCGSQHQHEQNVVVVDTGQGRFGLIVDAISDTQEIVIKPLGQALRNLCIYSGATILGDGQVALILDIDGIAQGSGLMTNDVHNELYLGEEEKDQTAENETCRWLVLTRNGQQQVVDMAHVVRLEEFFRSSIEQSFGHQVIQYRGEVLPLLNKRPFESAGNEDQTVQAVVVTDDRRNACYLVDEIIDIIVAASPDRKNGSIDSMIVGDRVSDVVDVPLLLKQTDQAFVSNRHVCAVGGKR